MSFFTGSSGFIINGGNFTSISLPTQDAGWFFQAILLTVLNKSGGTQQVDPQVLGKRKDRDSFDDYAQAGDLRKRSRCRSLDGLWFVNRRPQ